ncbi:hypothetical protein K435DRAFT_348454 [Dendrothele bispora CBS 962.96]|uniref:Uncharacterized protein n=1 Tax=Dendrothele bispora (strain CBS 962.96) TaxID=1314807 RepID=A0A4S8LEZ5_DENBC|nr:hypothetical protein K435DRAFT_348454 [Dendrothele bispora CBS 962.96]
MEFWPKTVRRADETSNRKKKDKEKSSGYPLLESGRLEAVNLVETNGRFQWTSPLLASSKDQLQAEKSIKVFPSTRPPLQTSYTTVSQNAEQSANFLRTYYPDMDIAADLVREELSANDAIMRERNRYDPLQGNLLEVCPGLSSEPAFLVFAMGESGCDLNVSPLVSVKDKLCFRPNATPLRSFSTPLQQITCWVFGPSDQLSCSK